MTQMTTPAPALSATGLGKAFGDQMVLKVAAATSEARASNPTWVAPTIRRASA
jgi:hypothetical protein